MTINLNNNFYLETINSSIKLPKNVIDINKITLIYALKSTNILLLIDFSKLDKSQYKSTLKKLLFVNNITSNKFGISSGNSKFVGYLVHYDKNSIEHNDFISGINAIFFKTRYERYNYVYDTVCNYLDGYFYGKNLCDFQDNKCGEKRNCSSITGCCHHFRIKCLGPLTKLVLCEHLNPKTHTCDAKCLACKLFTCDYLEKKGIKFRIKDILLLDTFFNPIQKYFIKYTLFTPKEKILKKLLKF